jgi:hypothetical protein
LNDPTPRHPPQRLISKSGQQDESSQLQIPDSHLLHFSLVTPLPQKTFNSKGMIEKEMDMAEKEFVSFIEKNKQK